MSGPDDQPGFIDHDRSLELIARTAVAQVEAGADIVAPSDRLDGRVQAIRAGLDSVGLLNTATLSSCRQVRQRLLRAIPRGSRLGAPVWRPTRVPDGPRQRAASCISRQRRVLNSQSGSPTRLAGREAGGAGSTDLNRSRRRRLDHHLLRQRRCALDTSNLPSDSERSAWNSLRRWKTTGLRVLLWRDG